MVRGASPLFSVASEGCPACAIGNERLRGRKEAFQNVPQVTLMHTEVRELCPTPTFWAGWPKPSVVT